MLYLQKKNLKKLLKSLNYRKFKDHCHCTGKYGGAAHSSCNLTFNVPDKIFEVFQSGSNYDYHFVMKELANEFQGQFESLAENTEKCKTFFVPMEKEVTKINKGDNESVIIISYKIKFNSSTRFMANLSSNFVDHLTEGISKIECKDCDSFSEYESVKGNLTKYNCLSCNKDYSNKLDEKLKSDLRTHLSFLTMISTNSFCYKEKVFNLISTWMIRKSLMKQHYLKKKNFIET